MGRGNKDADKIIDVNHGTCIAHDDVNQVRKTVVTVRKSEMKTVRAPPSGCRNSVNGVNGVGICTSYHERFRQRRTFNACHVQGQRAEMDTNCSFG